PAAYLFSVLNPRNRKYQGFLQLKLYALFFFKRFSFGSCCTACPGSCKMDEMCFPLQPMVTMNRFDFKLLPGKIVLKSAGLGDFFKVIRPLGSGLAVGG